MRHVASRFVLLVLALATLPLTAQTPPLEVPYRQFTLSNGLTVILKRDTEYKGGGYI